MSSPSNEAERAPSSSMPLTYASCAICVRVASICAGAPVKACIVSGSISRCSVLTLSSTLDLVVSASSDIMRRAADASADRDASAGREAGGLK